MQHVFSFPIRNSSCGMLIQQFPLNATIFLASLSEIFVESCLCNNFQVMQQFLAIRIFLEACLCNNFQILQQFFSFPIRTSSWCLLMQQFLRFPFRKFSWGLLIQQFPVYATIFYFNNQTFFLIPDYAKFSSVCNNLSAFLSEIFLEACLCNNVKCM